MGFVGAVKTLENVGKAFLAEARSVVTLLDYDIPFFAEGFECDMAIVAGVFYAV